MLKIRHKCKIVQGKIIPANISRFKSEMSRFEQKEVAVIIERWKQKRSNNQNAYYWALVSILANSFGYDNEELHRELKFLFNAKPSLLDPTRLIGQSTADLDTLAFTEYIGKIKRWAETEHGIILPNPEDVFTEISDEVKEEMKEDLAP